MTNLLTIVIIVMAVLIAARVFRALKDLFYPKEHPAVDYDQQAIDAAGKEGEAAVTQMIRKVLQPDDLLFTNVIVTFEDQKTELDNVIINRHGIFVIEAKNYSGKLEGTAEDRTWKKTRISKGGNVYVKEVRNPIPQVKRQIWVLSGFLRQAGLHEWIEGYAFLTEFNSPIESPFILQSVQDIYRATHPLDKNRLTDARQKELGALFETLKQTGDTTDYLY